jgi:hypothetical protein
MIIDNLDAHSAIVLPDKTDAVPFIDSNAELSFPLAKERLEAIARRNTQIRQ